MKTKTFILLFVAIALSATATAQNIHNGESFELNSTLSPSQSHEYTANSYIDLNTESMWGTIAKSE